MKNLEKTLEAIAQTHGIETLATQNADELDFHDLSVWTLKAMLEEAYKKGMEAKN